MFKKFRHFDLRSLTWGRGPRDFGVKKLIRKFWRNKGGKGVGRENLFWKTTITVFTSEKRKPRLEDHVDILSRVIWRKRAALLGLEEERETLKSSAQRRWLREKLMHFVDRHTFPWGTPLGWWEENRFWIRTVRDLSWSKDWSRSGRLGRFASEAYFIQVSTDIMTSDTKECFLKIKKYSVEFWVGAKSFYDFKA